MLRSNDNTNPPSTKKHSRSSPCANPPLIKRPSSRRNQPDQPTSPCSCSAILALQEPSLPPSLSLSLSLSLPPTQVLTAPGLLPAGASPPANSKVLAAPGLLLAATSPDAFLVHQFSPCTNPPSTKRHSSRMCSAETSEYAPLCPAVRANPFPKTTDVWCRLPLRTLFYGPEAAHLGDLMRLWVRTGVRVSLSFNCSGTVGSMPDTSNDKVPCPPLNPGSMQSDFRVRDG